MKIVFLPDAGPENPFQYEMAKLLRKEGHSVSIGKKYTILSTYKAIKAHSPNVIYYDWVHSFIIGQSWAWSVFKSLVFVFEIIFAKYFKKIRLVHTLHNLQNHAKLYLGLEKIVYTFFLKNCDKIRVYSETTKAAAIQKFGLTPKQFYVVQDLPYHYYYKNETSKADARKALNINEQDFVYLFFGEVKPYKGLDNFLPVFVQNTTPNTRLIVAGKSYDAAYFENLQKLAQNSNQVEWHHRFIEDDEVQTFFNAADVVVLPFLRIDHSGSIDLAMSFRKPVITLKNEATLKLLSHQSELLFETINQIDDCLINAQKINLQDIGNQNFERADSTNYLEILKLFGE